MAKSKVQSKKKSGGDELLTMAQALRAAEVKQLRFVLLDAKSATRDGLRRLEKYAAVLARDYRGFDLPALRRLPELCDRAIAQQRIVQKATRAAALEVVLPPAQVWRRKLLTLAQSLSESGAVDARKLAPIAAGLGALDNVQDVLDLVKLLTPHEAKVEAIHGAGALGLAERAAKAAFEVLGAGRGDSDAVEDAADLRDRYATLILRLHDRLRAALAAVTTYADASTLVPPLNSGRAKPTAAEDKPVPPNA